MHAVFYKAEHVFDPYTFPDLLLYKRCQHKAWDKTPAASRVSLKILNKPRITPFSISCSRNYQNVLLTGTLSLFFNSMCMCEILVLPQFEIIFYKQYFNTYVFTLFHLLLNLVFPLLEKSKTQCHLH